MLPDVSVGGEEHAEAGHQASWLVGKLNRTITPAVPAVRYQFLEQYTTMVEVEDPQAWFRRRLGVVDNH